MTQATWGEPFETFHRSGKVDAKGRQIGFLVGFNTNGVVWAAWVQAARAKGNDLGDFGPRQKSREFPTESAARAWAKATLADRLAKVK
jgi:hypothetical protein